MNSPTDPRKTFRIGLFQPGLVPGSLGHHKHEDLAHALRALGHDCDLLSALVEDNGQSSIRVLPAPAWTRGLLAEAGAAFLRTRMPLAAAVALARYLRREGDRLDLLYTLIAYPHGFAAALGIALSGWKGRLAIMPGGEDLLVAEAAGFGFRRFPVPRRLVGWALRRADAICCQSVAIRDIVAEYSPRGLRRIIPDNVDAEVIALAEEAATDRAARRQRARRRIDDELNTNGAPLMLALGRLHPVKGFDRLVDLLPRLPHRLVIAGPSLSIRPFGDTATALRARSRELRVEDRVLFTGAVSLEKSFELIAAADVLAIPSHREGMPKVAVEAAALGTPFVLTDTCGVAAFLEGRTLGEVVSHWDSDAFAAALSRVGVSRPDPDDARRFVRRFSPKQIAIDIIALVADIQPILQPRS